MRVCFFSEDTESPLKISVPWPNLSDNILQCEVGRYQSSDHEHSDLDHVGVSDYLHSSQCNYDGKYNEADHASRKTDGGNGGDGNSAEIKNGSKVDKNIYQYPEHRHNGADRVVVPRCQKLRHGIDFILQVDGNEKDGHNDQRGCSHPFIRGDCKSQGKAGP